MSPNEPELESIAASLEELIQRMSGIAEHASQHGNSSLAFELFEVERSLSAGHRRLVKAIRS